MEDYGLRLNRLYLLLSVQEQVICCLSSHHPLLPAKGIASDGLSIDVMALIRYMCIHALSPWPLLLVLSAIISSIASVFANHSSGRFRVLPWLLTTRATADEGMKGWLESQRTCLRQITALTQVSDPWCVKSGGLFRSFSVAWHWSRFFLIAR
jgi:hypothetical protein